MKNLALIAAVGYNNELGLDNRLLFNFLQKNDYG